MDHKTSNFTAYDFLGYLFPGALAVLFADASIAYHTATAGFSYDSLLQRYSSKDIGIALPFIIVSYIIGHFLSFLSSISIERFAVWMYGHPSKYLLQIKTGGYCGVSGANKIMSGLLRATMWVFLLPISSFDLVFGTLFRLRSNYVTPLDPLLRKAVWNSINVIIRYCGVKNPENLGQPKDHEFWKLAIHYAIDRAPNHAFSLRNYVVLYGFLRTTALVFVMAFWVITWHIISAFSSWWNIGGIMFIASGICFAAFASFMKFFQRYHEESLFAVTVAYAREHE